MRKNFNQDYKENKSFTDRISYKINRITALEGIRGLSSRYVLLLKYLTMFFSILILSSLTETLTNGVKNVSGGGWFMLACSTMIFAVGAVATMLYPNIRSEIIHKTKFYVVNVITVPGTIFSILIKTAQSWLGTDTLGQTLGIAIPVIFLSTLILPALVYVKEIVGLRGINRSKMDDEEAVLLWTRQFNNNNTDLNSFKDKM
jgi:hypothetical protein